MNLRLRALDPARADEIALVAERMRATLVEVLGPDRGATLYTLEWLEDRVRAHLDPRQLDGLVLLAEDEREVVGHLLARLEPSAHPGVERTGLIATVFVAPAARRNGCAHALFEAGEAWLRARGAATLAYDTAAEHGAMHALLQARGYALSLRAPEVGMVRFTRSTGPIQLKCESPPRGGLQNSN